MTIIGTLIIGQVQGSVGTSDADPSPNNYNHTSHYQNSASEGRKTYNKIPGIPNKKGDELSPGNILNKLDWRNLFTTAMKMFFGNSDDQSKQASRQV